MLRPALVLAALLAFPLALAAPVPAEAGWQGERCEEDSASRSRRSAIGGFLGGLAGRAMGRAGVPSSVAGVSVPVGSMLSDAIMNLLDCKEQKQAAEATGEAVRGGVGTTASWTSETRPGVTGSSSVTGEDRLADGSHCMTVTDIVIIEGEETAAPKRMCRAPGASGYVRV